MAIAESLKSSVEVAASRIPGLEDPDGKQTPQSTHCVDWNHVSSVLQPQLVLCETAEVVENHRHCWAGRKRERERDYCRFTQKLIEAGEMIVKEPQIKKMRRGCLITPKTDERVSVNW